MTYPLSTGRNFSPVKFAEHKVKCFLAKACYVMTYNVNKRCFNELIPTCTNQLAIPEFILTSEYLCVEINDYFCVSYIIETDRLKSILTGHENKRRCLIAGNLTN